MYVSFAFIFTKNRLLMPNIIENKPFSWLIGIISSLSYLVNIY